MMSSHNEYSAQRSAGAKMIIIKAQKIAECNGIKITKIYWDKEEKIIGEKTNHLLVIYSLNKAVKRKFPDEWLADYPGNAGNEKANAILAGMVGELLRR